MNRLPSIKLMPSEVFIGKSPAVVTTVLGSCVSVILHHAAMPVGLMCHCILPAGACDRQDLCPTRRVGQHYAPPNPECFRYVGCAVPFMLGYLTKVNIPKHLVTARLFGGSDMFGTDDENRASVGRQNVELALQVLTEAGLTPSVQNVGGPRGRKLHFLPHTGEVWMKYLGTRIPVPQQEVGTPRASPYRGLIPGVVIH